MSGNQKPNIKDKLENGDTYQSFGCHKRRTEVNTDFINCWKMFTRILEEFHGRTNKRLMQKEPRWVCIKQPCDLFDKAFILKENILKSRTKFQMSEPNIGGTELFHHSSKENCEILQLYN